MADVRLPGESYDDFLRRTDKGNPPATKGPRFAGESWEAYKRRLAAADGQITRDEQYPDPSEHPD